MRNLLVLSVFFLCFFEKSKAQKEFEIGIHVTPFVVFDFKNETLFEKSFAFDFSVCFQYTHHHFGVDVWNKNFELLNGYFIDEQYDVYLYISKKMFGPEYFISLGLEKYFEGDFLNKIVFLDFGSGDFIHYSASVGIIFEIPIWNSKKQKHHE